MHTLVLNLAMYVSPPPEPPSMFPDPSEPRQTLLWMTVGLVLACVVVLRGFGPHRRSRATGFVSP